MTTTTGTETLADDFEIENDDYYGEPEMLENDEPEFGSEGWSDYVLSLLNESEYVTEGDQIMPCCHGLRRVATVLLGDVSGGVKNVIYPDGNDPRRVVVIYELFIEDLNGRVKTYTEMADANIDNTDAFFLSFAAATASTRAEARALKKALLVKNVTADEVNRSDRSKLFGLDENGATPVVGTVSNDEETEDLPISEKQYNFLGVMGKKAGINVAAFIKQQLGDTPIGTLTKSEAKNKLIMPLDAYTNKKEETPEEIKGYNDNWRTEVE